MQGRGLKTGARRNQEGDLPRDKVRVRRAKERDKNDIDRGDRQ